MTCNLPGVHTLTKSDKNRTGADEQKMASKRFGVVIMIFGLLLGAIIIFSLIYEPGPKSILKKSIDNIQPFLDDIVVTEYEYERLAQGDFSIFIEANIKPEKTQELLAAISVRACFWEGFSCAHPDWPEIAKTVPGNYCIKATGINDPNHEWAEVCVDTRIDELTYRRLSY